MWAPGDHILLRYAWNGELSWVEPVTLVEDSPHLIALYLAMDTPIKRPVGRDGLPIPRFQTSEPQDTLPLRLGDARWADSSILWLARPGEAHAIGVFWWGEEREFVGWYGNLQAPLQRAALGFDTTDHVLDVTIAPDRSWQWKDKDEFAIVEQRGLIPPSQAVAIRAEGERVIAAVEANRGRSMQAGSNGSRTQLGQFPECRMGGRSGKTTHRPCPTLSRLRGRSFEQGANPGTRTFASGLPRLV